MQKVTMFTMAGCPYCRAAHRWMEELMQEYPEYNDIELEIIDETERLYTEILEARNCLSLKDLAVTGRDLMDAGVKPGPGLGVILNAMLEAVIEHPEYNTKEYLLERILPLVSS